MQEYHYIPYYYVSFGLMRVCKSDNMYHILTKGDSMKAYKKIPLILVLLLTVFTNLSAGCTLTSPAEKSALVALYDNTDGDNWYHNTNWKDGDPCANNWYGITCDCNNGDIMVLDLYNNNLTGTIPREIGNLTGLTRLNLYNNRLRGTILTEIENLINLTSLSLGKNQLTGSIPVEIGNLTNLRWLNLYDNQLTGSIPTEIGDLISLTSLHLYNNQLMGIIPEEVGNLTSLAELHLDNNYLSGEIPSSIKQTALYDNGGLHLETNCNLYSNDVSVISFMEAKMNNTTYEQFLMTQGHCKSLIMAPVIMYLLD